MKFHNIKEKLPEVEDIILAKIIPYYEFDNVIYYVFKVCKDGYGNIYFEEASGECYWTINIEDIVAWISLTDLDKQVDF